MPKISKYLIVGVSVYLLELIVIASLQYAGLSATAAVAIGFIIGTTVSFLLQKFVTFGDKRIQRRIVASQVLATGLLIVWNFGFTVLLTALFDDFVPAVIIRTVALGITTIWNYYLYKTHIFTVETDGK